MSQHRAAGRERPLGASAQRACSDAAASAARRCGVSSSAARPAAPRALSGASAQPGVPGVPPAAAGDRPARRADARHGDASNPRLLSAAELAGDARARADRLLMAAPSPPVRASVAASRGGSGGCAAAASGLGTQRSCLVAGRCEQRRAGAGAAVTVQAASAPSAAMAGKCSRGTAGAGAFLGAGLPCMRTASCCHGLTSPHPHWQARYAKRRRASRCQQVYRRRGHALE
jgi:hypothetical protein